VGWTLAGVAIMLVRLLDYARFVRRPPSLPLDEARRRFIALAWLVGVHWGASDIGLMVVQDPVLRFWFINAQAAVLSVAIARNNAVPLAAYGQVFLVMVPAAALCLCNGDPWLRAYCIMLVTYAVSATRLVSVLHRQSVGAVQADQANVMLLAELKKANDALGAMAATDGLTGIANRRAFDLALSVEWAHCTRSQEELSLLMIDIDHFKQFNDTLGHQAGDACLCEVAKCIVRCATRAGDLVARYGGEEFAVILPNTDVLGAVDTAERIRAAVQALAIAAPGTRLGVVTVSIGAAAMRGMVPPQQQARLIEAADRHLYAAKRDARNCVRACEGSLAQQRSDAPDR
jgi:diguanylate cyclase (GGDEF)-like protein